MFEAGITFIKKSSTKLCQHIIEINRLISDQISNCKSLFPIWSNWKYIKELFVMPNGLTEAGTKEAADIYYANLSYYPYQVYISWVPMDEGNVLYNGKKYAALLYQWHNDAFTEYSKISDAGAFVKNNIYGTGSSLVSSTFGVQISGTADAFGQLDREDRHVLYSGSTADCMRGVSHRLTCFLISPQSIPHFTTVRGK